MEKINVFSPFFYKFKLKEHSIIKDAYLNSMLDNFKAYPHNSHDWDVHTSYKLKDNLPNQLDWWVGVQHYKTYVNQFIEDYFRTSLDWRILEDPWYNIYGENQKADWHDHLPADFSAVHFIKYDQSAHSEFTFTNPDIPSTKLHAAFKSHLVDNLGDCDKQSYYKEQYRPEINEGDFIIFPSQMMHLVSPNQSDNLRITIAFNFNILNE